MKLKSTFRAFGRFGLQSLVRKKPDVRTRDHARLNENLAKLERHERRAVSRRERALRGISQAD
jgi:hypothetical protein